MFCTLNTYINNFVVFLQLRWWWWCCCCAVTFQLFLLLHTYALFLSPSFRSHNMSTKKPRPKSMPAEQTISQTHTKRQSITFRNKPISMQKRQVSFLIFRKYHRKICTHFPPLVKFIAQKKKKECKQVTLISKQQQLP